MAGDEGVVPPVEGVPGERVADGGEMDPDLVGAAGFEPDREQGVAAGPGEDPVAGESVLAIGVGLAQDDGTFHPADGDVDGAFLIGDQALGDGEVFLVHRPDEKGGAEGVFGRHAQAGGVFVQPADRAEGDGIAVAVGKIVAERVVHPIGGGVDRHVGRLVKDDEVLVLVEDRDGKVRVGDQGAAFVLKPDVDDVAGPDRVDHTPVGAVDRHPALFQLNDEAAGIAVGVFEEILELGAVVAGGDGVAEGSHFWSTRVISPT